MEENNNVEKEILTQIAKMNKNIKITKDVLLKRIDEMFETLCFEEIEEIEKEENKNN